MNSEVKKIHFLRNIILLFIALISVYSSKAQFSGYPLRNYSPKEYDGFTQNWICVQDQRGVLYFGNSTNILEYDGKQWRKIFVTPSVAIRSLYIDSTGTIYVGAVGDFGFLEPTANGRLKYHSLLSQLSPAQKNFSDVWKIHGYNGNVCFQTSEHIFCFKNNKISVIDPTNHTFASLSFSVNGKFFLRERKIGLMEIVNNKPQLVPAGEIFSDEAILGMIPFPIKSTTNYLTLSGDNGFFNIDSKAKKIEHIFSPSEKQLVEMGVLGMMWFNDSTVLVSTRGGIVFLNKKLEIKKIINKSDGLPDECIADLFFDNNHELWTCTNNGISKVSINSPSFFYNNSYGYEGNIEAITIFNNKLFLGTTSGIYAADFTTQNKSGPPEKLEFKNVEGTLFEIWNFHQHNDQLFAASTDGVFEVVGSKAVRVSKPYTNFISSSPNSKDRMYTGEKDGVRVFDKKSSGKWEEVHFFSLPTDDIQSIVELEKKDSKTGDRIVWLSTRNKGVMKLLYNDFFDFNIVRYDSTRGILNESVHIAMEKGRLMFITSKGTFSYNASADIGKAKCFSKYSGDLFVFNSSTTNLLYKDTLNFSGRQLENAMMALEEPGYTYYQNNSEILWVGLTDMLVRYDANVQKNYKANYNALIRKVTLGKDSVVFFGAFYNHNNISLTQPSGQVPEIGHKLNNISFEYSAPFFEREEKTMYSYKLIGFDTAWSDWSTASFKQYTNLYEGEYTFVAKAKNIYNCESKSAEYTFIILPPWYRTFTAYVCYFLLFILLIIVVVKLSVRRLTLAKEKLEKIVAERTAEVVEQKEELVEKNSIIEVAYNDIKASINYAKRIQESILPIKTELLKSFPESFVLFKPRDIVSGDFYWFAKHKNLNIVACVDCTGHGVPGAFMSMIGNTLLNEIVNEKGVTKPSDILNLLHERIRQSLKQDKNLETRDGMDIVLCTVDKENSMLQYAGANRPLYIINNGELEEIKPDKIPIGGDQMEQDRRFTNHEITIVRGSSIYMSSDGYADQFGGPKGKKFMVKKFHETLLEIQHLSMEQQGEKLKSTIESWQGNLEQIDDILVMGIKL